MRYHCPALRLLLSALGLLIPVYATLAAPEDLNFKDRAIIHKYQTQIPDHLPYPMALANVDGLGGVDIVISDWEPEGEALPGTLVFYRAMSICGGYKCYPFYIKTALLTEPDPRDNVSHAFAVADINGDGQTDIISVNTIHSETEAVYGLNVYVNNVHSENFQWVYDFPRAYSSEPFVDIAPLSIKPVDMDGDGDQDLLMPFFYIDYRGDADLMWYENTSADEISFTPHLLRSTASQILGGTSVIAQETKCVDAADMDRDGDIDIIAGVEGGYCSHDDQGGIACFVSRWLVYFENLSSGSPQFADDRILGDPYETQLYGNEIILADADQDLDVDIFPLQYYWWANDGLTTLSVTRKEVEPMEDRAVYESQYIDISDLDQDGYPEIICMAELNHHLYPDGTKGLLILHRDPDDAGHYLYDVLDTQYTDPLVGTTDIARAQIFDLDLDGDQDIVVSALTGIYWYENKLINNATADIIWLLME